MKIGEVLNSNVPLLPFEEIKEIFRKDITRSLVLVDENPTIIGRMLVINRVTLGLTKVLQKDSGGKSMLIPTWSFFGYEVNKFDGSDPNMTLFLDKNNEFKVEHVGRSFLTINAIDGSIIDPALGY